MKSKDSELISNTFARLNKERENLISSLVELAWYMRGGITYTELYNTTPVERDLISRFIEKRLDKIKDSPYPVY